MGLRVTRGRDWHWGEQDGGQDHEGTVQGWKTKSDEEVGTVGVSYPLWARVRWDSGGNNLHEIGAGGKYALCVVGHAAEEAEQHSATPSKSGGVAELRPKLERCEEANAKLKGRLDEQEKSIAELRSLLAGYEQSNAKLADRLDAQDKIIVELQSKLEGYGRKLDDGLDAQGKSTQ